MSEARIALHPPVSGAPAGPAPPWHNPAARQAIERIGASLANRRIVALVGLSGVGKSTLLTALATSGNVGASVYRPGERPGAGALLVDDAHRLSTIELEALLSRRHGVVLAGPYSLLERLAEQGRKLTVVDLAPLRPEEREELLTDMLEHAGEAPSLLPPTTMAALGRQSGGRIGPLLAMTKLAIFLARLEGGSVVALAHVEQAGSVGEDVESIEDKFPAAEAGPKAIRWLGTKMVAATLAAGLVCLAAFLWHSSRLTEHVATLPASVLRQEPVRQSGLAALPPMVLPPTEMAALPPLPVVPFHVAIHVPPTDRIAFQQGVQLALQLRSRGYIVYGPDVAPRWKMPSITYYFSDDANEAIAVAATLDPRVGPARQIDHPGDMPAPGLADIMLPGSWHTARPAYRFHPHAVIAREPAPVLAAPLRAIADAWRWMGASLH